jgi:Cu/Ag efflux pump CusA
VTVRVFGSDLGVLQDKAEEISKVVAHVDGVSGARVAAVAAEPTMEVEVDLTKARDAGVKPGDVRRAAATLLSGIRVGNLFEDQKVFDVQIWSTPETRNSLSSVQDLLIDTPSGKPVRLGDVATVRVRPTPPVIRHEDISRFVDVAANVSGRNVGDVAADVRDRLGTVSFPLEYHAELVGTYADQQAAQRRVAGLGIAAAIGMFLLLQAAFGSWRLAAITFLLLPVAVAGAPLAAWIDGGPWTLATAAGSLAVLAFAVRSFVSLVGRYQRLRADGVPFGPEVVDAGTRDHATPSVVAALASAVVLVPAIVSGGVAGLEVLRPMAVALAGGLVTSTLVTLFLVPGLYLRFGPRREPEPFDFSDELDQAERELATGTVGG